MVFKVDEFLTYQLAINLFLHMYVVHYIGMDKSLLMARIPVLVSYAVFQLFINMLMKQLC